ncbi:NapC/NirT family cytochrome c [Spirabiliibacterium falconis]|uniref:NapC/NirT family cytochrome c n=1 Tax=Spirabiliibacterium falconis TaxID=572023 RepID=UPI001F2EA95E|nr:NapC/NirT family cytochrome c [Spirabiliibacterium falconis]
MAGRKKWLVGGAAIFALGALALWGTQKVFHHTNTTEFCVSCHSMHIPEQEWQGSNHFMNKRGIRAECHDCHVPHQGFDYLKTKFLALKDVWGEITGKIPDQEAYEKHRLTMAQSVWKTMKEQDSATCRSCHNTEAWLLHEQSKTAQKMHKEMQSSGQTCIDCHKGIVHFMPEMESSADAQAAISGGDFSTQNTTLYSTQIGTATVGEGQVRLMPYAQVIDWKAEGDNVQGVVHGWQQAGAENLIYQELGKRILVAVLDDDAKSAVNIEKTVHDDVTNSDWREVSLHMQAPKAMLTANIKNLNDYGENLNQTHCGTCHAVIGADHYTANQWIGVINSMKDRTSMNDDQVRALTIYLQHHAKDSQQASEK